MAKKNKVAKVSNSVFTGRLLNLIGTWILMILIIVIMAGIGAGLVVVVGGVKDVNNIQIDAKLIVLAVVAALLILFGLAWAVIRFMKWETKHTIISGNRVKFNGNAFQLLGNCFKWMFLTIITVGIYALWLPIKVRKWKVKHMELQPVYGYDYGQVHFYNY
ncbi:MAG: DUF898 domain-containing protein [Clostridiales bacterium]|nr:DUF898 domain-containing protein [Clostridiales bacterium]